MLYFFDTWIGLSPRQPRPRGDVDPVCAGRFSPDTHVYLWMRRRSLQAEVLEDTILFVFNCTCCVYCNDAMGKFPLAG